MVVLLIQISWGFPTTNRASRCAVTGKLVGSAVKAPQEIGNCGCSTAVASIKMASTNIYCYFDLCYYNTSSLGKSMDRIESHRFALDPIKAVRPLDSIHFITF